MTPFQFLCCVQQSHVKTALGENFAEKKKADFKQYVCLQSEKKRGGEKSLFLQRKTDRCLHFSFP